MAAEETGSRDRTAAIALIAAGYGVGAGLSAIVHSLASGALGFRGIFALAVVPLAVVVALRGWVEEPSRFMVAQAAADHPTPVLGAVGPRYRARLAVVCLIGFAISVITGPASSFVFLYAQDVVHQRGLRQRADGGGRGRIRLVGTVGRAMAGRPPRPEADRLARHGRRGTGAHPRLLGLVDCARRGLRARALSGACSRPRSARCSPSCSRHRCVPR